VLLQAAASEYPNDVALKFTTDDGVVSTDPWTCHDACDSYASCLAVFIKKEANDWVCYRVNGDYSQQGTVTSAIKADPNRINVQPWNT
jgi:hypothetical protein